MPIVHETVEINADPDTVLDLIMRIEEFPLAPRTTPHSQNPYRTSNDNPSWTL